MNTNGPDCPKCQRRLPYRFAFTLFNPYSFRCPACRARLRSKHITLEIIGYGVISAAICWFIGRFYIETTAWNTTELVIFILVVAPCITLIAHFYFWKTGKLTCKDSEPGASPKKSSFPTDEFVAFIQERFPSARIERSSNDLGTVWIEARAGARHAVIVTYADGTIGATDIARSYIRYEDVSPFAPFGEALESVQSAKDFMVRALSS